MTLPPTYPSGAEYMTAVQNPAVSFRDPDLCVAKPQLTRLGMPKPISGNFASVFDLSAPDGRRFAVKCFTRDVPDQRERYEAISRHLAGIAPGGLSQPWKMDFEFLPEEVLVNGRRWPVMKMAWVEGARLDLWLADHHRNPLAVQALAARFAALIGDLERLKIGHGDLQHGNLLVAPDNTLRLVDYDGMYVPALAARHAAERGHRHYQSPARGAGDYSETVDRFSAWVIYLSLTALAADPLLWLHLREQDAEYLLVSEEDYKSPTGSWRLDQMASVSPELKTLVEKVRQFAAQPLPTIPALVPVKPIIAVSTPSATATGSAPGLPSWLEGHLAPNPTIVPVTAFTARRARDLLVSVICILAVLGALTDLFTVVIPTAAADGAAVLGFVLAEWGRRARPEWRTARQARRSHRALLQSLGDPVASLRRKSIQFTKSDEQFEKQTVQTNKGRAEVEARRTKEHAVTDRRFVAETTAVDRRLRDAEDTKRRRIDAELDQAIKAHVDGRLRSHRIVHELKGISGLGPAAAQALADHGIHTAADINVSLVYSSSSYTTRMAYFRLSNGFQTRIEGIGEKKATTLANWRDGLAQQARRTAPTSLPAAQLAQINSQYTATVAQLKAERGAAQARVATDKEATNRRLAGELANLDTQRRRLESQRAAGRAEHDQYSAAARAKAHDYERIKQTVKLESRARRRLSFHRYLRFALFGS
jgi:predicted flap endonuclease-1-like 5' DNA nuclease